MIQNNLTFEKLPLILNSDNYYKESNNYFVKLINVFCSITTHMAQKVCNLQCTNLFEAHIIISQ